MTGKLRFKFFNFKNLNFSFFNSKTLKKIILTLKTSFLTTKHILIGLKT
jgi:hypothetical protein